MHYYRLVWFSSTVYKTLSRKHFSFKADTFEVRWYFPSYSCQGFLIYKSVLSEFYKIMDVIKYWNACTINFSEYFLFPITAVTIALRCSWRKHFSLSIFLFFKYLIISSKALMNYHYFVFGKGWYCTFDPTGVGFKIFILEYFNTKERDFI